MPEPSVAQARVILTEHIQKCKDALEKATPGPWRADWDDNGQWYIEPLGLTGSGLRGDSGDCLESANACLIASTRNSLPAHILALDALLDRGCEWAEGCCPTPLSGLASRPPRCPTCAALIAVARALGDGGEKP